MKNTLALVMVLGGATMLYSGIKGWSIAHTFMYFVGEWKPGSTSHTSSQGPIPLTGGDPNSVPNPDKRPYTPAPGAPDDHSPGLNPDGSPNDTLPTPPGYVGPNYAPN